MLLSTQLLVWTLLGSGLALPGASQQQTTSTKCASSLKSTSRSTLKSTTKCTSSLKSTPKSTLKSSTKCTSSPKSTLKSTTKGTSSLKPTSRSTLNTTPKPTPAPSKPVDCKAINSALTVLKGLGAPASSYCSSYLHLPPATSTTITLPAATTTHTTLPPATIVITITPSTEIVTITPTTETITITDATEVLTITPSIDTITITPTTETATVITSTVTVTATATPNCNNKRSEVFKDGYIIEQTNNTIYAHREPSPTREKRTIDLKILSQFAAEKVSAGCSCLGLPRKTVTLTVTPSKKTISPTAFQTATAIAKTTKIAIVTETDIFTATETAIATATETETVTATATVTMTTVATATVTIISPCPCNPPGTLGCTIQNFIKFCCRDSVGTVGCAFTPPGSQGNGFCL